jgi:carboxylesterase type B
VSYNLRPVLVWIYGGGSAAGYSFAYPYLQTFAEELDVVLVAFNYRLGPLGYLALPELRDSSRNTSGNYGVTDAITALQWVQQNIYAFGGDAKRVTVIGQSSGATAILALLTNPSATSLFQRVISLSASGNITMELSDAEAYNQKVFVPATSCAGLSGPALKSCLLQLSVQDVMRGFNVSYPMPNNYFPSAMYQQGPMVIVDGVTVPQPVTKALQVTGAHVDILLQSLVCETESSWKQSLYEALFNQPRSKFIQFLTEKIQEANGTASPSWPSNSTSEIDALYSVDWGRNYQAAYKVINEFYSDIGVALPMFELGKAAATNTSRPGSLYVGRVECAPSLPVPFDATNSTFGIDAFHMWDYLAAVGPVDSAWTSPFVDPPPKPFLPAPSDLLFGLQLRNQWREFINSGKILGWLEFDAFKNGGIDHAIGRISCERTRSSIKYMQYRARAAEYLNINGPHYWWAN